ncbi:MAG: lipopolysaccharide heptosyltransferase II [Candidatus Krumholzibacteriia bacterium]
MTDSTPERRSRRLLLVAPNWLGDLVMFTPVLERLERLRHADAPLHVTLAVRRCWLPLVAEDPRVDALLAVERSGAHGGVAGLLRLARRWRAGRFDAVLLAPPSLRVALAARLAGIPLRVGYRSDARGPLLTHGRPVPPRGERHHSEELLALADDVLDALELAAERPPEGPLKDLSPRLAAVERRPARVPDGGPPLWAVGLGATYGEAKAWPAQRVAEFLDQAVAVERVRAVLVGTADARVIAAVLRALTPGLPWRSGLAGGAAVVDLTGRTGLGDLVEVLRGADGFAGNDSGPMHVAAALGVPTVGVFGSTSPAWTGPRGPRATTVVAEGFPCHPCFRRRCPQERFCLDAVTGAAVAQRLLQLGARSGRLPARKGET